MTLPADQQVPVTPVLPGRRMDAIVHTEDLTKQFGDEIAVSGVSIDINPGTIFGFIGPSGSGKTTTVRMLTGYYAPSSGVISVFGKEPKKFAQSLREKIGYMPQLFVLYPHLSVWENLNFAASIYGMKIRRHKELDRVLDFVELSEHRNKLARNISGGMQRRLSLASTLVHDPELLFLDEPTAGIDPVLRLKFWEHFRSLRSSGKTLFVTTQYVGEAAYCDLVGVMGDGHLIAVDTPEGLRTRAYGGDMVDLRTADRIPYLLEVQLSEAPFVDRVIRSSLNSVRLIVKEASTAIPALLEWLRDNNIEVESVEEFLPPFDDVFVELVRKERANA